MNNVEKFARKVAISYEGSGLGSGERTLRLFDEKTINKKFRGWILDFWI